MKYKPNSIGWWMAIILLIILLITIITSCSKTVYVDVPGPTKYETKYVERNDTTYVKDSVYIKEMQKGDTIRIVEYRYRDRYKYVSTVDTFVSIDTVTVKYPVEVVKTERYIPWIVEVLAWVGIVALALIAAIIIYKIRRFGK